jgi:hypothetical protein
MRWSRPLCLLLIVLAGACSLRSAIETMTSPEDRAFAQSMVDNLRSGNAAWLEQHFAPELWQQSAKEMSDVPGRFPSERGTTEIVNFSVSSSITNGRSERSKAFTLVTHGNGRWTVTAFRTHSTGGPDRVVEWRVEPRSTPPEELRMMEAWDRVLPWVWGGFLFAVLALGGLIFWLVRRSRRKRAAQATGTP